ncbi:MAG TPA: type I secretion system permease/ATPase [Pseudomonas sp.]|nr:type I secretion system permease/ATPase [Pseudomonas sp.]
MGIQVEQPAPEALRGATDDPLLDGLLLLCRLHGRTISRGRLTGGLPLPEQRLTAELMPRAAARAGLRGRWLTRTLEEIPPLALPALLLLRGGGVAVLLERDAERARVLLVESGGGETRVELQELRAQYGGQVFFALPHHAFDLRPDSLIPRTRAWFRDTLLRSRWLYADALVASLLINLIGLCTPLFVMNVYDRVVPNQALATLWVLAIGIIGAYLFDLLLKSLRGLCLDLAGRKTDLIVSATLFERILGMPLSLRPARIGSFAQNIHDFQGLRDFLSSLTLTALIDLPFCLLVLLAIGWLGGPLVWVPLLAFGLALGLGWLLQIPLKASLERTMALAAERQSTLIETLGGLEALKVQNAEGERQHHWEQTLGTLGRLELRTRQLSSLVLHLGQAVQQLSGVVLLVWGVYLIIGGGLSMGGLIACYMLNSRALAPLGQLSGLLTRYQQARLTKRNVDQLMTLPQERAGGERPPVAHELRGDIECRRVSLCYPDQREPALRDLSLRIAAGERVAILGRSGSGKSSLARLLVGLYPAERGGLLLDGLDIEQLDIAEVRRQIGHVPQDIQLFSGTLRDNLVLGARQASDERIREVAELAGVQAFAQLHPQGYGLPVGERGQRLSGGQRQQVALARALLLDPPLLVLDEPTSAMDAASEERLIQRLLPVLQGKTLVLVTHRTSLLALVERVLVLDRGRLVADGPRDAVLAALREGRLHGG